MLPSATDAPTSQGLLLKHQRLLPFRLPIHTLRAGERAEFLRWFHAQNTQRTRGVGWILLFFALIILPKIWLDLYHEPPLPFLGYSIALSLGLASSYIGSKRHLAWLARTGEFAILLTAIAWMFIAVAFGTNNAAGLTEFVIGTLALALFRWMSPYIAILVFGTIGASYGLLLIQLNAFEVETFLNAALVCVLAIALSWGIYNGRIIEYRNKCLVEALHSKNRELLSLALLDPLTGLPNRRYLDQLAEQYWHDDQSKTADITLILIDIDFFKNFNDQYGHPEGDRCLQQVAQLLTDNIRDDGTCLRLGGEEFAVLVRAPLQQGVSVAQRLVTLISQHSSVTISAGVSSLKPVDNSFTTLYKAADEALYSAKHQGRNRVISC